MNTQFGDLDTVVQEALTNDAEFQTSLGSLSEEEKTKAIESKRKEILANKAPEFFENMKKNETIAEDQRKRAEKAERGEGKKDDKKSDETPALSTADLYALMASKVEQPDVEEVQRFAKMYGKTIGEVLAEPTVIAFLKEKVEKRNSARAAEKGGNGGTTGSKGLSEADVLERSRNGERFEPGSPEAEMLYKAKRGIK